MLTTINQSPQNPGLPGLSANPSLRPTQLTNATSLPTAALAIHPLRSIRTSH